MRVDGSFAEQMDGCDMGHMQRMVVISLNTPGSPFGVRCSMLYNSMYAHTRRVTLLVSSSEDTTASEEDEIEGPE